MDNNFKEIPTFKNYKTKEEAILQRLIWELNNWKNNAPQIEKIKIEYPSLYEAMNNGYKINEDASFVFKMLKYFKKDPHCPCQIEKTADTKCMCKLFREQEEEGECHCGLYIKTKQENNWNENFENYD